MRGALKKLDILSVVVLTAATLFLLYRKVQHPNRKIFGLTFVGRFKRCILSTVCFLRKRTERVLDKDYFVC